MIELINKRLYEILSQLKEGKVKEAMIYSTMSGGKRLRGSLLLTALHAYGIKYDEYLDIACAIEMIHTYSLIHDDLPAMDNDDLRRGKPSCHKQFDEATAILAGDGLLNESMNVIVGLDVEDHLKIEIIKLLFNASGMNGMIYGQQQDIYFENKSADLSELENIHHYKTGCLIAAPLQIASIIAKQEDFKPITDLGFHLGLAFQIQDDILDVISNPNELGKNTGSDATNHKSTYVTFLGIEKSQKYITELFNKCLEDIYGLQLNHGLLIEIIEKVIKRVN